MYLLRILGFFLLWLPNSAAAQRHVFEEIRTRYYDVQGASAAELNQAVEQFGPRHAGRTWAGYTKDDVRWDFRYTGAERACVMEQVRVHLDVEVTLPRWHPPPGVSAGLVEQWQSFIEALAQHERGHREIARQAAREIYDTLSQLRMASCAGMEAEAQAAALRTYERSRTLHRQYDRETEHGLRQGALRPVDSPAPAMSASSEPRSSGFWILLVIGLILVALIRAQRRQ